MKTRICQPLKFRIFQLQQGNVFEHVLKGEGIHCHTFCFMTNYPIITSFLGHLNTVTIPKTMNDSLNRLERINLKEEIFLFNLLI